MFNLNYEQVVAINKEIVTKTGERFSVLNENNIKSALGNQFQPYELEEQAIASTFKSLIINHGFANGNKRTAVICLRAFSVELKCNDNSLYELTYSLANEGGSKISVNHIANILFDLDLEEDLEEDLLDDKGNQIAKIVASLFKGECGPFGGEDPKINGNTMILWSQATPGDKYIFNDDGSIDAENYYWGIDEDEDGISHHHYPSFEELAISDDGWFYDLGDRDLELVFDQIKEVFGESLKTEEEDA